MTIQPLPRSLEGGRGGAGHLKRPYHVNPEDVLEIRFAQAFEISGGDKLGDSRVVHQHVDTAKAVQCGSRQSLAVLIARDVAAAEHGLAACVYARCLGLVGFCFAACVVDHDAIPAHC